MLFQKAKQYETANFKGLYNFINFIDKLKLNSGDMGSAKLIGENDNVIRIMSIHKSKGLEFPVVFLSSTGKQFNLMDLNKNILIHQEIGIGVKYINYDKQIQYDTLSKSAIKNRIFVETLSEEMRILYVALTRAKEKLIITGISKDYLAEINKMKEQIERYSKYNNKINPILIKQYKRYLDWILLVVCYEQNKLEENITLKINKKQELLESINKVEKEEVKVTDILNNKQIKEEKLEIIKKSLNYSYPNNLATIIPTKTSVTNLKQMQIQKNYEYENEFPKPKFLRSETEEILTPAQKGTLVHLCLQKLDEKKDYNLQEINKLIDNLMKKQIITKKEAESINPFKILEFTKSKIWKNLQKAKEIYREKPFYINMSANEIYNEDIEENILVQGIIDLYYIDENDKLILVDYKTDYVQIDKETELVEKYKKQLEIYQEALEKALNKKVYKKYIYSTYLGKEIEV